MRSRSIVAAAVVATVALICVGPATGRVPSAQAAPVTWVSVAEPFTLIAAGIGLALAAAMRRPPRS